MNKRSKSKNKSNQVRREIKGEMSIRVTINDWTTDIYCENGMQTLSWLINYSLFLYCTDLCLKSGLIYGYRNLSAAVNDDMQNLAFFEKRNSTPLYKVFDNNDHIHLMQKEEYANYSQNMKKQNKAKRR